jgi:chemotaxis protein MotA
MAGGKISIVMQALPFEMIIIGGAGVGTIIIGNSMGIIKKVLGAFGKTLRGSKWSRNDYQDLLLMLFQVARLKKQKGNLALEAHVEEPDESAIFSEYPKIMRDHTAKKLILDTLRMVTLDVDDPHKIEAYLEAEIEKHHKEEMQPADAIQTLADAFPALGIVAAVLGVIKTMASINEPPAVLGKLIGSALVGTFLGVFLSYGIAGPFAQRIKQIIEDETQFYYVIRDTMISIAQGDAPQIAVEIGRTHVPSSIQPSFYDIDEAANDLPRIDS